MSVMASPKMELKTKLIPQTHNSELRTGLIQRQVKKVVQVVLLDNSDDD